MLCGAEGRQGKDPVSPATAEVYEYRAEIMKAYQWDKALQELEAPDIVAFRSWLLKNYSRDQAKKALSSFHSVLLEMVTQGMLATDPAASLGSPSSSHAIRRIDVTFSFDDPSLKRRAVSRLYGLSLEDVVTFAGIARQTLYE